ncbi:MAG: class I SAM-dependent methyltransferase [Microbacterium sp.]|uniref:class I SAM-dependent methyltransferase n=1 Tax=Microbacterium sp. TaxID=51671 RepID=UPI0039E3F024
MDTAELAAILTPDGLRLLDGLPAIERADDVARAVSRLRAAGHSPDLVSAVVGQARLRTRARAKFGSFAERMLFTPAGLEQATRMPVAALHAGRFRDAGLERVADLGCGIGGDALGLAALGLRVDAVDADEATAAVAAFNLAPFGDAVTVRHGRAEDADLSHVDGVWLDPARRAAGSNVGGSRQSRSIGPTSSDIGASLRHSGGGGPRRLRADEWSPPLEWAFGLAARLPAGVKLGPALDRDRIPSGVEAQWISVDGSTIELVLWSGVLARPGVARAALVIRGGQASELTAAGDAVDAPTRPLVVGGYLHEPDGAVIRARLIGDVARSLDAGMLDERIAYLVSETAATSPFVQTFRVRESLPLKPDAIRAALARNDIGTLEIKKRGVDVDPAEFRRKLKPRGSRSATLILTRAGGARVALLAERVAAADR